MLNENFNTQHMVLVDFARECAKTKFVILLKLVEFYNDGPS